MCDAPEGRSGLLKSDIPVGTDSGAPECPAGIFSRSALLPVALRLSVRRLAVFDIGIFQIYVDMVEKIMPHKIDVALIAGIIQPRIFVQIGGADLFIAGSRSSRGSSIIFL